MSDFENEYIKGKELEQLIDELGKTAEPGSRVWHVQRAAIDAKIMERMATPRKWAAVALGGAIISALAAVASAVAAFT